MRSQLLLLFPYRWPAFLFVLYQLVFFFCSSFPTFFWLPSWSFIVALRQFYCDVCRAGFLWIYYFGGLLSLDLWLDFFPSNLENFQPLFLQIFFLPILLSSSEILIIYIIKPLGIIPGLVFFPLGASIWIISIGLS